MAVSLAESRGPALIVAHLRSTADFGPVRHKKSLKFSFDRKTINNSRSTLHIQSRSKAASYRLRQPSPLHRLAFGAATQLADIEVRQNERTTAEGLLPRFDLSFPAAGIRILFFGRFIYLLVLRK
jgi:hypothetical protein